MCCVVHVPLATELCYEGANRGINTAEFPKHRPVLSIHCRNGLSSGISRQGTAGNGRERTRKSIRHNEIVNIEQKSDSEAMAELLRIAQVTNLPRLRQIQAGRTSICTLHGGYIVALAHHIQDDTPLENIFALFEAVKESG